MALIYGWQDGWFIRRHARFAPRAVSFLVISQDGSLVISESGDQVVWGG